MFAPFCIISLCPQVTGICISYFAIYFLKELDQIFLFLKLQRKQILGIRKGAYIINNVANSITDYIFIYVY